MYRMLVLLISLVAFSGLAETLDSLSLPKPDRQGGKPLMQALSNRSSAREFAPDALPEQVLSNLLWAGFGVNRPDGHRTAPSAMNRQTVDVYALTANGAYVYEGAGHRLRLVVGRDLRALAGTQSFVASAPVNLVYVSDYTKMASSSDSDKLLFSGAETGFISQNVYLYCASEGLATVVRASIDRAALAAALKLRPDQKITLAQTVGRPRK